MNNPIVTRQVGSNRIDIMQGGKRIAFALHEKDKWRFRYPNGKPIFRIVPSADWRKRSNGVKIYSCVDDKEQIIEQAQSLLSLGFIGAGYDGPKEECNSRE